LYNSSYAAELDEHKMSTAQAMHTVYLHAILIAHGVNIGM